MRLKLRYKHCSRNCQVHKKSRNKCQFCRFKKCVLAGMSHTGTSINFNQKTSHLKFHPAEELRYHFLTAIRFGRTPLAEREKLIVEFHTVVHRLEPESEKRQAIARNLYDSYLKHFPMTRSKAKAILSGKDGENTVSHRTCFKL